MPAADQRSQHVFDDRVLPDHRFLQFSAQRLSKLTGALALLRLVLAVFVGLTGSVTGSALAVCSGV